MQPVAAAVVSVGVAVSVAADGAEGGVDANPDVKTSMTRDIKIILDMKTCIRFLLKTARCGLALALALAFAHGAWAAATAKTFATPDDAVAELISAVHAKDTNVMATLFGHEYDRLVNPDRVQATNEFIAVAEAIAQGTRVVREAPDRCVVEFGVDHWPFPVPIVQRAGRWFFDTAAGAEEILNRRIGRNELSVLQAVRAYVQAQREYASRDRDDDQVLEFAQRIASTPGRKDGLFWPPDLDGSISPLGPLVAGAQAAGYAMKVRAENEPREPFHGYFFKILTRQGKHAPGGKYNYIINGNMIGGFALVAWPAEYGNSGIMTFIVNQQGRVFQKDLGPQTTKIAAAMETYDPDRTWTVSHE